MVTRLSPSDASFFRLENTATPMYVGSLSILRRPRAGLSYETVLATVEQRLAQIPRYRQKVREVRVGSARPVWVDDGDFDITYHVRRSALPSPGSDEQLHELIARLAARPLDKSRPLWEMYLVEGLSKNRVALYTKSHQALVNGMTALEINHVIADRTKRPPSFPEDIWVPERDPGNARLMFGAVGDWFVVPGAQLQAVGSAIGGLVTAPGEIVATGRRVLDFARNVARGTAPSSPLNATVSRHRRFTVACGNLDDYRTVRAVRLRRQRRGARRHRRCPGQLADVARGGGVADRHGAGHGAAVHLRRRPARRDRARPGHQPGDAVPGRPAGGGAERGGAVVADRARDRVQPDGRPPGGRQDHRHAVRIRAAHLARHGHPGRHQFPELFPADVQPVDHQRAGGPVADVRRRHQAAGDLRGAATAAQPGAGHQRDVLQRHAVFRHQRRP
ncbi:acyltransferase, WS/DGAT/MGAT [Mycobacterium parascrofulaceum ATCC BAA-614]|uniref:Acyltransferase, WS/DGAT/MGAT n=1 Tax=Mycobacterium parascrofulaceum ATCC BAA-614 TaxID=525368 RepID=D5PD41_9MYCO|nr:acyltransferase, WS/DGAT/MGAT [Mycobacterium parascrofulaceum ATCC BAA-614]